MNRAVFVLALTFISILIINKIGLDLYLTKKYVAIDVNKSGNITSLINNSLRIKFSNTSLHSKKFYESGFQLKYANFIYNNLYESRDSTINGKEKDKSNFFYYVLGIIILIAAGLIFKKRYEDYLKDKNLLNK